jgi:hypothetical protein
MSKHVTAEQGLCNVSMVLEGEALWTIICSAWDKLPEETIARSYAGHHQLVCAIVDCKGGDDFVRAKNGLSFGIRKHAVPYYVGEETVPAGVEMVTERVEDANGAMMRSGLKWVKPDITNSSTGAQLVVYECASRVVRLGVNCQCFSDSKQAAT